MCNQVHKLALVGPSKNTAISDPVATVEALEYSPHTQSLSNIFQNNPQESSVDNIEDSVETVTFPASTSTADEIQLVPSEEMPLQPPECLQEEKRQLRETMQNNATTETTLPIVVKPKEKTPLKMICDVCQMHFANKIHYKNHMSTHEHTVCPNCNKQIKSAYFKKHISLHEDSPAMCELCGITCKNPASLKMHIRYYHQKNVSVCEDCGRSFRTKTKLFYHQRKDHLKERNYKCETCGKCFFSKGKWFSIYSQFGIF